MSTLSICSWSTLANAFEISRRDNRCEMRAAESLGLNNLTAPMAPSLDLCLRYPWVVVLNHGGALLLCFFLTKGAKKTFAYWIKHMDEPVPLTLVNIGMLSWFGDSAGFGTIPQQRNTVASTNSYAQCVHIPSECGASCNSLSFNN